MKCRLLRRRRAHFRAPTPSAAAIAAQLRAQIPCSTDPRRLERLACEAEGRPRTRDGQSFLLRSLRQLSRRAEARLDSDLANWVRGQARVPFIIRSKP
jgi:hypothetical protein